MEPYTCSIDFTRLVKGDRAIELGVFSLYTKEDDPIFESFDLIDLQIVEEKEEQFKISMKFFQLDNDPEEAFENCLNVRFNPEHSNRFIKLVRRFALKLKDTMGFYYFEIISDKKMQKLLVNAYSADVLWKGHYSRETEEDKFKLISEDGNQNISS